MKIAFFAAEYYPQIIGGLGTYATEVTKQYVELGHDVAVFTFNQNRQLITDEVWKGIGVHRPQITDLGGVFPLFINEDLQKWGKNLQYFCDVFSYNHISATEFVNKLIRKTQEKYDVVAVHDWLSAPAGLIIKKELPGMPIVYHVHSTEQQRTQGKGSEVIKSFELKMAEVADRVITVSETMKDYIITLGYPQNKTTAIWNGVDPDKYSSDSVSIDEIEILKKFYNIRPDEKVLLFVGRLASIKGVPNLIQAMPKVFSMFPKTHLVILGVGEEYSNLVQLAIRLGIARNVSFRTEFVSEHEKIVHYAMSDVCVFPSITEPFGIVGLEAMAMSKPVVVGARGVNGLREQVIPSGPDRTGVHVNAENPQDIAWGICETLIDTQESRKWGENGSRRVRRYFTWKNVAENTIAIYKEAIENSRKGT